MLFQDFLYIELIRFLYLSTILPLFNFKVGVSIQFSTVKSSGLNVNVLTFVIIHLYLLTIGEGFRAHVKPMLTGFEEIDLTPEQEAYLESNEPKRLKPTE